MYKCRNLAGKGIIVSHQAGPSQARLASGKKYVSFIYELFYSVSTEYERPLILIVLMA